MYGKMIKEARIGAGITQADAASRVGLSDAYLCLVEAGKRRPPPADVTRRLADIYAADAATLLAAGGVERGVLELPVGDDGALANAAASIVAAWPEISETMAATAAAVVQGAEGRRAARIRPHEDIVSFGDVIAKCGVEYDATILMDGVYVLYGEVGISLVVRGKDVNHFVTIQHIGAMLDYLMEIGFFLVE